MSNLFQNIAVELVASIIVTAVLSGIVMFQVVKGLLKRETRLYNNLKRPVYVVGIGSENLDHVVDILKRTEFFDVKGPKVGERATDLFKENGLVVCQYANLPEFERLYSAIKSLRLPVVILSKPGEITPEHIAVITAYTDYVLCNTPLRLISDVFSIMATYPESKK